MDPSSIFGGSMTSDMGGSVDVEGVMNSLMGISKSLMPQMESVANELKDVIDTPEIQTKFESVKNDMQGILGEITPKRKGTTIMMPMPQGGQSQSMNSPQGGSADSIGLGVPSSVNIKEYYKHITTLVTAYS